MNKYEYAVKNKKKNTTFDSKIEDRLCQENEK